MKKTTPITMTNERPVVETFEGPIYTGTSIGYVIEFENKKKFYIAGDTALFYDMKAVIGDFYAPDVAFFPIDGFYCMDWKQAVVATNWVNPRYVVPYHYQTFPGLEEKPENYIQQVKLNYQQGKTRAEVLSPLWGEETEIEGIKVTWLGHAAIILESPEGTRIIIDPWLEINPKCPPDRKTMEGLGKIDLILLTHGHPDHFDIGDLKRLVDEYSPHIITQWELGMYLQQKIDTHVYLMNIGGTLNADKIALRWKVSEKDLENLNHDINITMVQAIHSSSAP